MKKKKITGYVLASVGAIAIFIASFLNSICKNSDLSDTVYVYDVASTLAVLLLFLGLFIIFKKKKH